MSQAVREGGVRTVLLGRSWRSVQATYIKGIKAGEDRVMEMRMRDSNQTSTVS